MACNICGFTHSYPNAAQCPNHPERNRMGNDQIGWTCPTCGKGNAPDAKTCGHCAERVTVVVGDGANSTMRAGDMDPIYGD